MSWTILRLALALACCCSARRHSRSRPIPPTPSCSLRTARGNGNRHLTKSGANQTKVVLEVKGAPSGASQPVHIHKGTCAKLDPKPAYPLARREREIGDRGQRLADSLQKGYAINGTSRPRTCRRSAATSQHAEGRPGAGDRAHGHRRGPTISSHVTPRAAQASLSPDRAFAYVDSRGRRRPLMHDKAHVRNALARFNQVVFESDVPVTAPAAGC